MSRHATVHTVESLLANTRKRGECRLWKGTVTKDGLPKVGYNGGKVNVARLMYLLSYGGTIRDDEAVMHVHECRHRECINPEHLALDWSRNAWRYRKNWEEL